MNYFQKKKLLKSRRSNKLVEMISELCDPIEPQNTNLNPTIGTVNLSNNSIKNDENVQVVKNSKEIMIKVGL